MSDHRIFEVRFTHGQRGEDAPLVCTCSWGGKAGDFSAHRVEAKAGRGIRNRPDKVIPWSLKGGTGQW